VPGRGSRESTPTLADWPLVETYRAVSAGGRGAKRGWVADPRRLPARRLLEDALPVRRDSISDISYKDRRGDSMSLDERSEAQCSFCKGSGSCGKCRGLKARVVVSRWWRLESSVPCSACYGTGRCQLCRGTGTRPRQRVH
jgi:hypothetical protein